MVIAVFREFDSGGKDRSAEDRRRHRELVEESIKNNIISIIAEESIIGQSKDKKIKIPIRSIKEFQFTYEKNVPGIGSGDGSEKRGDKIGEEKIRNRGGGEGQAGNQEGEDIYEMEITIDELVNYLFDDLDLPYIDRRKLAMLETARRSRNPGFQLKGIPPRLAKRRTIIERVKRKQSYLRDLVDVITDNGFAEGFKEAKEDKNSSCRYTTRFPFAENDLRYRRLGETNKKDFNAVVICIMDVSGSMDHAKKYMARSFYFLLYHFIKLVYSSVEVIFIAHTTTAKEVNENDFFHRGESGGTYISSGYEKALEIIEQRYNPANWNIYTFHCSDGDNWTEDNKKAVEMANKLCEVCNLFGYGEITNGYYTVGNTIKSEYHKSVRSSNFAAISMSKKEDILTGLKKLLEKEAEG